MNKTHTTIIKDSGREYEMTATMRQTAGRSEISEMTIKSVDGNAPITQKLLRSISISDAIRAIHAQEAITENVDGTSNYDLTPLTHEKWASSDAQLRLVAMMYRDAYNARVPVQNYVSSRVNRPVSSVNRWIRVAREKGYLGKPNGTRGGEM